MKKKLLFVSAKWCDANPSLAHSNEFHNFFSTFSKCRPDFDYDTLHIDEAVSIYGSHIDKALIQYCSNYPVDIIIFSLIGLPHLNPSLETYDKLKKMGIYLVALWPDTGPSWGLQTIESLKEHVDLHVSYDNPRSDYHDRYPKIDNHISLWTPEDDSLFHDRDDKVYDVTFMGTLNLYRDRIDYLNIIKDRCPISISGGQRSAKLSPEQYASVIRKSKIGINFPISQTGVFYQAKGRIFEYTACKSLLMDMENPSTRDFFVPNKDYVEFVSPDDLINKINYYLKHEEERLKIAENGYNTFIQRYSAKIFWDTLIKEIELRKK